MSKSYWQGPWRACKNGACSCGQIWSIPFDAPIATVKSGPWGDSYPALRHVDASEGMSGTGLKIEAYMEMIEYGSISEDAAISIRRLIAAAPDLLAALKEVRRCGNGGAKLSRKASDMARDAIARAQESPADERDGCAAKRSHHHPTDTQERTDMTTDRELIERLIEYENLLLRVQDKELVRAAAAAIERLSAGSRWRDMSSARKDRPIWVWCPAYQDLSPIVSLCEWHPDAGFCVDELRTPALWTDYVAGNPPGAQPDTSAEEGAKHHAATLRSEEEKGYARGLRDAIHHHPTHKEETTP